MDYLPICLGIAMAALLLFGRCRPRFHSAWLWGALPLVMAGLCLPWLLSRLHPTQYNLVELLRQDRMFPGAWLALLCLWGPLTASWAAGAWRAGFRLRAACWAPASCLVAWGVLRRSVTVESIHDLLGSPVLSWPADLEYVARFSAIYLPFVWLPVLLALLYRRSKVWLAVALAYGVALIALSPLIINGYTPSDNVPELFRPGGHAWFAALCLLAPGTAVLCERVRRSAGLPAAACALALISPVAYAMLDRAILLGDIHGLDAGPAALGVAFAAAVATCLMPAATSTGDEHASAA